MSLSRKRILWPLAAGIGGSTLLTAIYLVILSIAESPQHALDQFWQDRWFVLPIILGFGVQAALYITLKKRLFVPTGNAGPSSKLMGISGTTSTIAMVACCAHHVADVLPILGLTAAASFLAQYRIAFMVLGLGTTFLGIAVMSRLLFKEYRKANQVLIPPAMETL